MGGRDQDGGGDRPVAGARAGPGAGPRARRRLAVRARDAARRADRVFRRLQLVSASLYSLGHGGNDAQKTMGIIAVLLYSQGKLGGDFHVPLWVVLSCQAAMALGTLLGGWRIVHTMGSKITRLTPDAGLLRRDRRRDHAVRGDLRSAFRSRRPTRSPARSSASARRAARRRCAGTSPADIVIAWVVTLPAAALAGAAFYAAARLIDRPW